MNVRLRTAASTTPLLRPDSIRARLRDPTTASIPRLGARRILRYVRTACSFPLLGLTEVETHFKPRDLAVTDLDRVPAPHRLVPFFRRARPVIAHSVARGVDAVECHRHVGRA